MTDAVGLAPIYQGIRATLYQADAREVLPHLTTESVDLVITDPPYGVQWRSGFRAEAFDAMANDTAVDRDGIRQVLAECVRLVGQNRHLYVFGPDDVLDGLKVTERATLVWSKQKTGMGDLASLWGPAHESITFAVSKHRHAGQTDKSHLAVRLRKGSVLTFSPPTGRKVRHPSEKPLGLLQELVESSSRVGEVVLDPFAGVGSTGVAAVLAGRRAILVEISSQYVELAIGRLARAERLYAEKEKL